MAKKLLLADDSLTIQKVVGIVFANLDYELLIADNGDAALDLARKEFPDLVIADIGMPGKDGLELCREIKKDAALGSVPVLLLPGAFENFDESKATDAGADGWLTKPFESQVLIDKVEQLLDAAPVKTSVPTPAEPAATVVPEPIVEDEPISFVEPENAEPAAETEDIWDAVTFEEEDLQAESAELATEDTIQFEEPASELEEFAPVIEEVAPITEEVAPIIEEIAPIIEEIAPIIEEVAPIIEEIAPIIEEIAPVIEEIAPIIEEIAPIIEEVAPIIEEVAPIIEEVAPIIEEVALIIEEVAPIIEEEPEDEIFDLGEEDIFELEEDAIITEDADSETALSDDVVEFNDQTVADPIDFSAPEPVVEAASIIEPDSASEPEPSVDVFDEVAETSVEPVSELMPETLQTAEQDEKPLDQTDTDAVEEQLLNLKESDMEAVILKVAGPVIEKMAAKLLEQVVWEVVPDLAESMIKDEIRKIKEGAA